MPLLKVRTKGCTFEGSEHVNQDAWGAEGNTLWVIDGATRATDKDNDAVASWVGRLSDTLARLVRETPSRSLQETLSTAIQEARQTAMDWHPSATISLARLGRSTTEILVLGDAGALVLTEQGRLEGIQDNRLQTVAPQTRKARREARRQGDISQAHALTRDLLNEEDRWRNRPGGYWVIADDPNAPTEAVRREFDNPQGLILMTDGVYEELGRLLINPENAWTSLTSDLSGTLYKLHEGRIRESGAVDDLTAVSALQTS